MSNALSVLTGSTCRLPPLLTIAFGLLLALGDLFMFSPPVLGQEPAARANRGVLIDLSDCARAGPRCDHVEPACGPSDGDCAQAELYAESHALLIGASKYKDASWAELKGVQNDIREVERVLKAQEFEVKVVHDPDHIRLEQEIREFIYGHGQKKNNRLIIYFAGHGHSATLEGRSDKMGYIVPIDAPDPNSEGFVRTALSMELIQSYARLAQSKHVLFVFDSCFSGSFFRLRRAPQRTPLFISQKTARPVRQIFTAGSENEPVPDKSVFSQYFVTGLNGQADTNEDGYITGTELGEFLRMNVTELTRGAQHPQTGTVLDIELNQGDFVFDLPNKRAFLSANSLPQSVIAIDGLTMPDFPVRNQITRTGRHQLTFATRGRKPLKWTIDVKAGLTTSCLANFAERQVSCRELERANK